jgi:hypothetical protein
MASGRVGSWDLARKLVSHAIRVLRRRWGVHARWNAMTLGAYVVVSAASCPASAWLFFDEVRLGPAGRGTGAARVALILALALVCASLVSTMHRVVSIELARDPDRGGIGGALRRVAPRMPSVLGLGVVLGSLDSLGATCVTLAGWARGTRAEAAAAALGVVLLWLVLRAWLGLAAAGLGEAGAGVIGASRASARRLRGFRASIVIARALAFVLVGAVLMPAAMVIAFLPRVLVLFGAPDVVIATLTIASLLVAPFLALHVASVDAVVEATLYDRLSERIDTAAIARTFD